MTPALLRSRRPGSSVPWLAAVAGLVGAVAAGGCTFELAPLQEAVTGGTDAGVITPPPMGGSGGDGGTGASGEAGSQALICGEPGTKSCPGALACSPKEPANGCDDPDCNPCPAVPGAVVGCSDQGQCFVEACLEGFADCDGDAIGRSGSELAGSNGCEHDLGVSASVESPLMVELITPPVIDGERADWTGRPVYRVESACASCTTVTDDQAGPISSPASVPPRSDLVGYFRVGWDAGGLYVFAEAFDDHVRLSEESSPTKEDGIVLLFDGLDNRETSPNYEHDDVRVYFGTSGKAAGFNRPLQNGDFELASQVLGERCYRVEARVSWSYIVGFDQNGSQGQLPPVAGNSYGFDISFNDWDPPVLDPTSSVNEHQSQIFWIDPGDQWWRETKGFGSILLLGPPESG